jgi:hypothetical protein
MNAISPSVHGGKTQDLYLKMYNAIVDGATPDQIGYSKTKNFYRTGL